MDNITNNKLRIVNSLARTEKTKLVMISFLFLSMALTPMVLSQSVQAGLGGLKVNVHVNSAGKICVASSGENLMCKTSKGPGVVQFQFGEGVVEVGDKFRACFKGKCVNGTNGPEKAPEDVYLPSSSSSSSSSGTRTGSKDTVNEAPQSTDSNIKKTISTSNPDLSILSVSNYSSGNYFYIVGEVLNKAPVEKTLVKVTATLYNSARQVIGTSSTFADPSSIPQSESAPFKLMVGSTDVSNIDLINSYKLGVSGK
jgi:hypothetical protein